MIKHVSMSTSYLMRILTIYNILPNFKKLLQMTLSKKIFSYKYIWSCLQLTIIN